MFSRRPVARKKQQQRGIVRMIPWKYGSILCIVVSLLLLHLWEQTQVSRLDARIRRLRSDIEKIEIENGRFTAQVIALSEWSAIVERAEQGLKMTYPSLEDITLIQCEEVPSRREGNAPCIH